jgi:flagellar hook-length control protein FliK
VASTGTGSTGTTVRTAGTTPGGGPAAQVALSVEAQLAAASSATQTAGAAGATAVTLPGQAVGAAGAGSQDASLGLADAADGAPVSAASGPAPQDGTPEFNLAALTNTNVGQVAAASAAQVDAPSTQPVAAQIADGALFAARNGGQSVQMVLQPEGLGTVTVKVTVERGGLAVHLAVDNPLGRELVHNSWAQLQAALEQRGLTVQSLQLDLTSGGRGNGDQFGAFQQFTSQQQSFAGFSQFGQSGQAGQQARGGSGSERRGVGAVPGIDEPVGTPAGVGTASRVDYRI